jgi:epidermal growth factor receptor substrate 15
MASGFTATPAEIALVNQIFALHDPQKLGILTGDVAVRAFSGAKLPPATLGEIWGISDDENNGWLSRKGVAMALRLIAWAQKGEKPVAGLLSKRTYTLSVYRARS